MPEFTDEDACAMMWTLWADSGHLDRGCSGWTWETRERTLTCSCGVTVFVLEPVPA
jgi:hypothetical protein